MDATHSAGELPLLYVSSDSSDCDLGGAQSSFDAADAFQYLASSYFEMDKDKLVVRQLLARGAFSSVMSGTFDLCPCAIKIQEIPQSPVEQANLLGELAILHSICRDGQHEGLVGYYGAAMLHKGEAVDLSCTDRIGMELADCCSVPRALLVLPIYENGALREALKVGLSWALRTRIARDVTAGLMALHGANIIHRDIKTTNILLDSNWRAKVCDFNLAIYNNSEAKNSYVAGTTEFMAPETLLGEAYSFPADIFSFGIMMFEMLTGRMPQEGGFMSRSPRSLFALDIEAVNEVRPEKAPSSLWSLATDCCDHEEDVRPDAAFAFTWLEEILMHEFGGHVPLPRQKGTRSVRRPSQEGHLVIGTRDRFRERAKKNQLSSRRNKFKKWAMALGLSLGGKKAQVITKPLSRDDETTSDERVARELSRDDYVETLMKRSFHQLGGQDPNAGMLSRKLSFMAARPHSQAFKEYVIPVQQQLDAAHQALGEKDMDLSLQALGLLLQKLASAVSDLKSHPPPPDMVEDVNLFTSYVDVAQRALNALQQLQSPPASSVQLHALETNKLTDEFVQRAEESKQLLRLCA
jgi:serine/threonine protein kinase